MSTELHNQSNDTELAGLQDVTGTFGEPMDDQVLLRLVRQVKTEEGLTLAASAKPKLAMARVAVVLTPGGSRRSLEGLIGHGRWFDLHVPDMAA